jgi:hypothetical protein
MNIEKVERGDSACLGGGAGRSRDGRRARRPHLLFSELLSNGNRVDLFKDFSQKLILTVLSNLFRTLRTHCITVFQSFCNFSKVSLNL